MKNEAMVADILGGGRALCLIWPGSILEGYFKNTPLGHIPSNSLSHDRSHKSEKTSIEQRERGRDR